jgi:hypothetical protein
VAFDVLVERGGASGDQESAAEGIHEARPFHGAGAAEVEARNRGDDDKEGDVGLSENDVGPRLIVRGYRFGARIAAHGVTSVVVIVRMALKVFVLMLMRGSLRRSRQKLWLRRRL